MRYLLLVLLLHCSVFATSGHKHGSTKSKQRLPKRVHVAKKEDLLGDDTSKIDEAEYRLQSMISPETHEASRFFNKAPSRQIGNLRVDTMSPAQISFIQSTNQWHKYYRPSSSSEFGHNSNIYPEDPVLFPEGKQLKSNEHEAGVDFLEGLGDGEVSRHHEQGNTWNSDSLASYGDAATGYEHPKDYLNSPFTDKSWWNSKSEDVPQSESYHGPDGNTVAEPMPKNDPDLPLQNNVASPLSHFGERAHGMPEPPGLAHMGNPVSLGGEERASFLDKLEDLKGRFPPSQTGDDDKVFFDQHQKISLGQSGLTNLPFESPLRASKGLGTALAEELLQRSQEKERENEEPEVREESTGLIQGIREAASVLRAGRNNFGGRFASSPLIEENASQRANLYHTDFGSEGGHVVLIRSHQVKDSPERKFASEPVIKSKSKKKYAEGGSHARKVGADTASSQTWNGTKLQNQRGQKLISTFRRVHRKPRKGKGSRV